MPREKCPHCGRPMPRPKTGESWDHYDGQFLDRETSAAAARLGAAGRGAAKRRDVDYAELARKSHAARAARAAAALPPRD